MVYKIDPRGRTCFTYSRATQVEFVRCKSVKHTIMVSENPRYHWNAGDYARHSDSQKKWGRELMDKLCLSGDEYLLDIGCGDGKLSAQIARRLPHGGVLGVDSSPEMIALACDRYPPGRSGNLRFAVMDARRLGLRASFDVVFSNAALHWVIDHRPVLAGIHAALRPGGRVLIQMGGRGNAADVVAVIGEIMATAQWCSFFKDFSFPYGFYGPGEYRPWLAAAGFDVRSIRLTLTPRDMMHEDVEKFKGWIRTTWLPYLQRVPRERREAFIDTVAEKYLQAFAPDENGCVHVRMQRLEVAAVRP